MHGKGQSLRILSIARVAFIFIARTETRTVHGEEVAMNGQLSDDEFEVLVTTTTAGESESLQILNGAVL